jgi:hypothetical protein
MHNKKGRKVAEIARNAIALLKSEGIVMPVPDNNNANWGWGVKISGELMDDAEFKSVYMYHMQRFVDLGNKYQDNRFISDQVFGSDNSDSDDYDDNDFDQPSSGLVTNIRIDGQNIRVFDFDSAMRVYGLVRIKSGEDAARPLFDLAQHFYSGV